MSRTVWERMVERTAKRARTTEVLTGGTHEPPPEQVQMAQTAQDLARWALQRQSVPEMQAFMRQFEVTTTSLTMLAETPLVEPGPQTLIQEDGPHGFR